MFNIFYDSLAGFNGLSIWIAAGHGYGWFDDVTVIHKGLIFGNFYLITNLYQSLTFHFKFFLTHKNSSFLYSFLKIFEKIILIA